MTGRADPVMAAAARAEAAGDDRAGAFQALLPLFESLDWLGDLARRAGADMAADPWHLPSLAASRNGAVSHLALARSGRVTVGLSFLASASARAPDAALPPPSFTLTGQWTMTRLLSPDALGGRMARLAADGAAVRSRPFRLAPGRVLRLDESREALWLAPPERAVLLLRARIHPVRAMAVRRFDLASGALLGSIAGDDGQARATMMMSVLRALGDARAVPLFAQALDQSAGSARWSAMREWLALDVGSAWPRLAMMAQADADPAVRQAASQTIARFAPAGQAPCPA